MTKAISKVLFTDNSAKAAKGEAFGHLNAIHYMSPADFAGFGNLCPWSTASCRAACLGYFTGRAAIVADSHLISSKNAVRRSRDLKAEIYMTDRKRYRKALHKDVERVIRKAARMGLVPAIRFNGSTDVVGEPVELAKRYPEVKVNEYTKSFKFAMDNALGKHPANLRVCFSRNEENEFNCDLVLASGGLVSVVFGGKELPKTWRGFDVVDGDSHDLLHLHPRGVVLGLLAKGAAKKDKSSGFVVWS